MRFRPCIDIHNGKVKQIVGGSLTDVNDKASENFVSEQDAGYYARLYRSYNITGGHIILLNPVSSPYYPETKKQAMLALQTYPGGLQIGGGITADNAKEYLLAGASHVIVTSYVFKDGQINWENLNRLVDAVGKERIVLDVSARKKGDAYYIVTDRWQRFTEVALTEEVMRKLSTYCDEFLIHAVDVEGKARGIETELVAMLGNISGIKMTYAGGISNWDDLEQLRSLGQNRLDFTVGSALDIFGGTLKFTDIVNVNKIKEREE